MKNLLFTFCTLLFCTAAIAQVNPILGNSSLCVGSTVTYHDSTAGGTWSSSTPAVATISTTTGILTGVSAGITTISYTVGTTYSIMSVTVSPIPGPIFGCNNIGVGDTLRLSMGIGCSLTGSTPYTYMLSGGTVATMDFMSGTIIGVSPGSAFLTIASAAGCMNNWSFTVSSPRLISPITGAYTKCEDFKDTVSDANSGGVWSSSNVPTATISPTSEVFTLIDSPTLIITYSMPGGTAMCSTWVLVNHKPNPISGATNLCIGDTTFLSSNISSADCSDILMGLFTTSNPGVASVPGTTELTVGVVGISAGNAIITFTDLNTGCYTTDSINVGQAPILPAITGLDSVCLDSTISLSITYIGGTWHVKNSNASVSSGSVIGLSPGIDTVFYTASNSCGSDTTIHSVNIMHCSLSTDLIQDNTFGVNLFPNPANNHITIVSSFLVNSVVIYNLVGQVVSVNYCTTKELDLDITAFPKGIYFMKINNTSVKMFEKE